MRFLIINTDYSEYLQDYYGSHPHLVNAPYEHQMKERMNTLFGVADFYSHNLNALGHEAHDIHINNRFMQAAWEREFRLPGKSLRSSAARSGMRMLHLSDHISKSLPAPLRNMWRGGIYRFSGGDKWIYRILREQIEYYRPDVLLNQTMDGIDTDFLKSVKKWTRLLVGQHAATQLQPHVDLKPYDLVISSFPPTLDYIRQNGGKAELSRLGFDERVLTRISRVPEPQHDISFVGSFYRVHSSRTKLLESLVRQFPQMRIWGPDARQLDEHSAIHKCFMGPAWGIKMYEVLQRSRMTVNHHGDVPPFANNCRLYEATGVGALLITDWKQNLSEIFEPGKEVVTYRTAEECAELIRYYLEHENERRDIALAGQKKTLREHTYYNRMQELAEIVQKHM